MKKFMLTVLFLLIPLSVLAGEPLRMVYFQDFEPLSWRDESGRMRGILVDVATEAIEKRLGVPLSHEGYPWARAQFMVKEGQADGFVTAPTAERREYVEASTEDVLSYAMKAYAYRDNPDMDRLRQAHTLEDLFKFSHIQYVGNGWAKENLKVADIFWADSLSKVLELLAGGSGSLFVSSGVVVPYNLKRLGLEDRVVELPLEIQRVHFHLCLGKKSPFLKILPEFDRVLAQMRKDGALDAILKKY